MEGSLAAQGNASLKRFRSTGSCGSWRPETNSALTRVPASQAVYIPSADARKRMRSSGEDQIAHWRERGQCMCSRCRTGTAGRERKRDCDQAREVGRLLAERKHPPAAGGLTGGMAAAAAEGCSQAGENLGRPAAGNRSRSGVPATDPWRPRPVSGEVMRNGLLVRSSDGVIAVGGGDWGTLSEVAVAHLALACRWSPSTGGRSGMLLVSPSPMIASVVPACGGRARRRADRNTALSGLASHRCDLT